MVLNGIELKDLLRPCVYVWRRSNGQYLYIGVTSMGVARFSSHTFIRKDCILTDDVFEFYYIPDDNRLELEELESYMIIKNNPLYNVSLGQRKFSGVAG